MISRHFCRRSSKNVLSDEAFLFAKNNGLYYIKPNYQEYKGYYQLGFTHLCDKRANLYYNLGYEGIGYDGKKKIPNINVSQEKARIKNILNENLYLLKQFVIGAKEIDKIPFIPLLNLFNPSRFVYDKNVIFHERKKSLLFDNLFINHQSTKQNTNQIKSRIKRTKDEVFSNNLIGNFLSFKKSGYMLSVSPSRKLLHIEKEKLIKSYNILKNNKCHSTDPEKYMTTEDEHGEQRFIVYSEIDGLLLLKEGEQTNLSEDRIVIRRGDSLTVQEYKKGYWEEDKEKITYQVFKALSSLLHAKLRRYISKEETLTSYGYIVHNNVLNQTSVPKHYYTKNKGNPIDFIRKRYFKRSREYNEFYRRTIKKAIMTFLDKIEKEIVNVYFKGYNTYINSPKFLSNIYVKLVTLRDEESVKGITENIFYYNLGAIKSKSNFSMGDISNKPFCLPNESI